MLILLSGVHNTSLAIDDLTRFQPFLLGVECGCFLGTAAKSLQEPLACHQDRARKPKRQEKAREAPGERAGKGNKGKHKLKARGSPQEGGLRRDIDAACWWGSQCFCLPHRCLMCWVMGSSYIVRRLGSVFCLCFALRRHHCFLVCPRAVPCIGSYCL